MKLRNLMLALPVCVLVSCGWTGGQKEALKTKLKEGVSKGFAQSGKTVDPQVLDKFADCVTEKCVKRWGSWTEFTDNQTHPDVAKFRDECAKETKLFDNIK